MCKIRSLSLLFCLALSLTVAAVRADDMANEDNAVETITKLGGTVTRDEEAAGKPVIGVSLERTLVTNQGLKELKAFKHLQSLNLNRCYRVPGGPFGVTPTGVKELQAALPEASILR